MNNETLRLQSDAWTVFNAAYHESGVVKHVMMETGKSLYRQAEAEDHTARKNALFDKLDQQNREVDTALRLRQVRESLKELHPANK